ncbi:MAG TPA: hypothetical protein VGB62_04745 [Allosphingosinicella sp.]|jgi:hypothetical protein
MPRQLILIAMALAATPAAAAPLLSEAELEAAAAQVRSGRAEPAGLRGRRFQITIAPRQRGEQNDICTGYPSWGWYPKDGTFELSHLDGTHEARFFYHAEGALALPFAPKNFGEEQQWVSIHTFSCRYRREPVRRAENMYGEIVNHEPIQEDVTAIASRHRPRLSRALTRWDWLSVNTDEAGARALGARMVVRISGVIGQWSPGRSIVCGADDHSSLGVPLLAPAFSGCLINGRVTRVDYLDAATGKVGLSSAPKSRGRGRSGKAAGAGGSPPPQ